MPTPSHDSRRTQRITAVTVLGSLLVAPALLAVHVIFHSQLALAQAADSLSDSLGGVALWWAIRASADDPDDEHPFGHGRAQPIAALVVAVLVGVLSVEVLRSALSSAERPIISWPLFAVFACKIAFKSAVTWRASVSLRAQNDPALNALRVDAQSDVVVCTLSLLGAAVARLGWPKLDTLLAIPAALYIAASGVRLARENIAVLMGSSAPSVRRDALRVLVASIAGVTRVDRVVATFFAANLHVEIDFSTDGTRSLDDAHAIGHAVERRLLEESDVERVTVHVGPADEPAVVAQR